MSPFGTPLRCALPFPYSAAARARIEFMQTPYDVKARG
jgi:hypothetical protein